MSLAERLQRILITPKFVAQVKFYVSEHRVILHLKEKLLFSNRSYSDSEGNLAFCALVNLASTKQTSHNLVLMKTQLLTFTSDALHH